MKAAVWTNINEIEMKELPTPKPGKNEVLVRVRAAGVCATDVHMITGKLQGLASPPHVLGHEIAGEIAELGDGVTDWDIHDRVIINTIVSCGKCRFCRTGHRELCQNGAEIGYPPYSGGYAEYLCVPQECLVRLDPRISFEEGAIIESIVCPSGAVLTQGIRMGSIVFVQGAGPAGIAFIQLAKTCGAGKIIASARGAERLSYAQKFGADLVIDAEAEDVVSRVLEETDGIGADYVMDAAGTPSSIQASFQAAANGANIFYYGIPGSSEAIDFPVTEIILKQLHLHGVCGNDQAWEALLALVANGRIQVKDMVTHTFALEQITDAAKLIQSKNRSLIKAVIKM